MTRGMKKLVLISMLLLSAVNVSAQRTLPGTSEVSVTRDGDGVRVAMRVAIPRRSAPAGITLIHAPVITDGTYKVSMPPIVVQGRQAEIVWQRHERAADTMSRHERARHTENGETVDYRAEVPFQHWMQGARLELETVTAGCAASFTGRSLIAATILPPTPPEPEPEPEPVVIPPPSAGELLARTFPFVLPFSEFDPDEPIRFYDDERDNALTVYYRINSHEIDPEYADNRQTLVNLLAAIDVIANSDGLRVERMVVVGFASPEGPFAFNDRLAWERAVSVKEHILSGGSSIADETITVFNGSLDWRGLRQRVMADSRVPSREEVLELLDGVRGRDPDAQRRILDALRTTGGGQSYAYLADRIFPSLRNGTFIRVYFEAD